MNDGAKQAYIDQMTAQLTEWAATIEVVKARIAKGAAGMRIDYHEGIESWQKKEPLFKAKLEELRNSGAEGFETMKSAAHAVWGELNEAINSLKEKKN